VDALLTALLTSVLMALSAPGSASSDQHADRQTDRAHDVLSGSPESGGSPRHPEPRVALGDALDVDVALETDLVVTTTFRSLDARGYQRHSWSVRTSADRPDDWWIWFDTDPGRDDGKLSIIDPDGHSRHCGRVALDRSEATATLTLCGACIGSPGWVRVGTGVSVVRGGTLFQDDAQRHGARGHGWKLGPRVTRQ
jgi:hypothetical protein